MSRMLRSLVCCPLIILSLPATSADSVDPLAGELPVVLTPTRLRQSLAEVPASVTIITAEMIKRFGIASVPEALRLVPGMAVTHVTGPSYRINYHGTNINSPRRMNVLIDGVSVYRPALAQIDWDQLPVAIEDIDRIEVTRGPNSAAYGANSMLAIVNILTKHPRDVAGITLGATVGTLDTLHATARFGGQLGKATAYRLTAAHRTDSGFDQGSTIGGGHDGHRVSNLAFRSVSELGAEQSLDVQATIQRTNRDIAFIDQFQQTFPDQIAHDYYLNGRWLKAFSPRHELKVQGYLTHHSLEQRWRTCPPTATLLPELFALWRTNPSYATAILSGRTPSGGSPSDDLLALAALRAIALLGPRALAPTCVDANQNYKEKRYDLEVQDTYVFSDRLRMVSGAGLRRDEGDSQTYLAGRVRNDSWRLFGNVEFKPIPRLSVNAGGFLEKDELSGRHFSPRLAMNAQVTPNQTLRVAVSKAVRTPDIIEQRADWTYFTTNWDPPLGGQTSGLFAQSARSPGNLKAERIRSTEVGYLGNFPQHGVLVDVKVFEDKLTHLISETLRVTDFGLTNDNDARLRGAELQLRYEPTERWFLQLGYGYLDNDASTPDEISQYARHSGSLGVSYLSPSNWRASFAFYGYSGDGPRQSDYGREDLTLQKTFNLSRGARLTTAFTLRYLNNRSTTWRVSELRSQESSYDDAWQLFLSASLAF